MITWDNVVWMEGTRIASTRHASLFDHFEIGLSTGNWKKFLIRFHTTIDDECRATFVNFIFTNSILNRDLLRLSKNNVLFKKVENVALLRLKK